MADTIAKTVSEQEATEIRCQEKSKGGVSYEVILAEPAVCATLPKLPATGDKKSVSAQEIEDKLKAAEQRRLSLEAKKVADWTAKVAKIEEATRKKDERNAEFIVQTKEALDAKMEHTEEKREALLGEIREKLKIHSQEIEKARVLLEKQKTEERSALEDKLQSAAQLREENINKMLERLKEHERRAEIVRQNKAALANQGEDTVTASSG